MLFVSVAQVLVLHDDHVSITDFFEGAKAQRGDTKLSHSHTAAATTKRKKVETRREEEPFLKKKRFYDSLE